MNKIKILLNKQLSLGVVLASVFLLSVIIGFGIHLVFAWTGPTANPPGGITPSPPITTAGGQTINGNLTLAGDLLKTGADGQLAASSDKVFIDSGDSWLRLTTAAGGTTYADFAANNIRAYGNNIYFGSGARINSLGVSAIGAFMGGDDGTYEWFGWYSGTSRAGIFLWDGVWNGCTADRFCIIGDTHQLMLRSLALDPGTGLDTPVIVVDDLTVTGNLSVNGAVTAGGGTSNFVWKTTPSSIALTCDDTWRSIDITSQTSANAKIVILSFKTIGGRWMYVTTRRTGSTANREGFWGHAGDAVDDGGMIIQGLNSAQSFDYKCYVEGDPQPLVVGYIE